MLTQIRKEAVIGTSKILTEEYKDSLRKIPLLSQPLLGGKVREIYKENSEQQQNSFIAQSSVSVKSKMQSSDFFCHQKRLQNSTHFKASSFPNSDILPSIEHLSSRRRGPIATRQRSSGTYKTESTRVLLSDFSGPEEKPEIETDNGFGQTEHLCGCSGVQNGNSGKSQTGDSNQRLVLFPRTDRCLSSCTLILHSGSSIPIQSSSIWTNNKFLNVFTR